MFRWIAALSAASLLVFPGMPGMAQQDTPARSPAPTELSPEQPGDEPFEPLFMLDDDGRLVLIGPYGETEVDLLNPTQRGAWRAKLSRKIEVLIRAGDADPAYLELLRHDREVERASHGSTHAAGARKHDRRHRLRSRLGRWNHLRRLRSGHCRKVLKRLGLEGEEVNAVRPLLEQVLRARRELVYGDWRARRSLRHVTEPEQGKELLKGFRTGKRTREARLHVARQRLREVVTVKQECLLVAQGILD